MKADQIYQWITKDRLQMTRIHELLALQGCQVSYQSLRDYVEDNAWMSPTLSPGPLPADPDAFWGQPEWEDNCGDTIGPARVPDEAAALPRQLGRFPFWQGSEEFLSAHQYRWRAETVLSSGTG